MAVHEIFALISDNEIKEVVVGEYAVCNDIAHERYGQEAFAKEVTQYPVQEGDMYEEGEFRRYAEDGTYSAMDYMPTDSQKIEILENQLSSLNEQINSIQAVIGKLELS